MDDKYSDVQLKQALAKMLPEKLTYLKSHFSEIPDRLCWNDEDSGDYVLDTEHLHLCWLVEQTLELGHEESTWAQYQEVLWNIVNPNIPFLRTMIDDVAYMKNLMHATWQQRVIALAKVKGITI